MKACKQYTGSTLDDWISQQQNLLNLEQQAENEQLADKIRSLSAQECSVLGLSFLNLEIDGIRTSLLGRVTICLKQIEGKRVLVKVPFKVINIVNCFLSAFLCVRIKGWR
jgi:hypothetical protein